MRERVERQKKKNKKTSTYFTPENNLRNEQMQPQRASNSSKEEVWKDISEAEMDISGLPFSTNTTPHDSNLLYLKISVQWASRTFTLNSLAAGSIQTQILIPFLCLPPASKT